MTADADEGATVRTTMERALQDVRPPAGLDRDAMVRGRQLQRRRRVGLAAGGVAAVAVVAAISVPFLGEDGSRAIDDHGVAAPPTASASPAATAGATPSTAAADPDHPFGDLELPEGWWDMPADDMLAALEDRLPTGVHIADANPPGEGHNGPGALTVVLEGPSGTGLLSILLRGRPPEELPPPVTSTDDAGNEHVDLMVEPVPYERNIGCRESFLACALIHDGSGDSIGDVSTEVDGGTTYHNGDLLGPDGGAINIYAADSTGEKPGYEAPTADAPLLTFAQVRTLIQDPIWTSYQP